MKLKNFQDLIETRFTKKEIAEIEEQAKLEASALRTLQENVKKAVEDWCLRTLSCQE